MKNIALFSDGTGNSAGKLNKTNVWRLYKTLDLTSKEPAQIAYYDDGVGSSSFKLFAVIGGVFGWGLKRNVIDIYTFLCRNYDHEEKKDRVYCFGFSRGAFTIRVLADLVATEGLVDSNSVTSESELRHLATSAFRNYRTKYRKKWQIHVEVLRWVRDQVLEYWYKIRQIPVYKKNKNTQLSSIDFLGLWDTVDAYGLPIEELTKAFSWFYPLTLPNRDPSDKILRICHALALDDERQTFEPVLLNEKKLPGGSQYPAVTVVCDERVSQVWFSGAHSNVGGGYPDDALSLVSLRWMMDQADHCGLAFSEHERCHLMAASSPEGRIYDSRRGLAGSYRYKPRKIKLLTKDKEHEVFIDYNKVHESVFQRIRNCAEYAPIALPNDYVVVESDGYIKEPCGYGESSTESVEKNLDETRSRKEKEDSSELETGIWNLVWWRRVIYFASVGAALWLAFFPLIYTATGTCGGSWCFLGTIIRGAALLLPGFAGYWFDAFDSHPGIFLLDAALLTTLLLIGGWLQRMIRDQMQMLWQTRGIKIAVQPKKERVGFLLCGLLKFPRVYAHAWYQACQKYFKKLLVFLALLFMILLMLIGFVRFGFSLMSSSGIVCDKKSDAPVMRPQIWTTQLPSQALCQTTGYKVEKGKRYRITLSAAGEWSDKGLNADLKGLDRDQETLPMKLAVPIRRQLLEPWFKPIARVGSHGRDEYPLDPVEYFVIPESNKQLVSEIVPRASGELFLFLNDVALPLPKDWQWFYRNNRGTAAVKIEPVVGAEH